jgi:phospholipid-binding lipoprotein MlaA
MPQFQPIRPTARRAPRGLAIALILAACAAGSAHADAKKKNKDPLEKLNRASYQFNDALDRMALHPLAKFYAWAMPRPARTAVTNFVYNLSYPTTAINNVLQGKFKLGFQDGARFLVNTTVGIGGLFDPATHWGLIKHDEDFGQTLGWYGVPPGPYLVVPFFGPSDFRDAPGRYVDHLTDLAHYAPQRIQARFNNTVAGVRAVSTRADLLPLDATLAASFDPYAVVRDSYLQNRNYLVHDGNLPVESLDEPLPDDTPPPEPNAKPEDKAPDTNGKPEETTPQDKK